MTHRASASHRAALIELLRARNAPTALHPTAGAVAIGACHFLGALNVYIGQAAHVAKARAIAKQLRAAIRLP